MIRRKYPKRKKGQLQTSQVRCVRLNAEGVTAFEDITEAMTKGYKLEDKPSLGLLMQSVLIQFAKGLSAEKLKALRAEIKAHGCKPPKDELRKIAQVLAVAKKEQV